MADLSKKRQRINVFTDDGGEAPPSPLTHEDSRLTPRSSPAGGAPGGICSTPLLTGGLSLNVSLAPRACSVPSHARLDVLMKQTEALRRLDADAHEAMRSELQEQVDGLRAEVERLTTELSASAARELQRLPHAEHAPAPSKAISSAEVAALRASVTDTTAENNSLRRQLAAAQREALDATANGRTAVSRLETALADERDARARVEGELARLRATGVRADVIVEPEPSRASGAHAACERHAAQLREAVRTAERTARAAAAESARVASSVANSELLSGQLAAAELRCKRLEAAAAAGSAARSLLCECLAALAQADRMAARATARCAAVASDTALLQPVVTSAVEVPAASFPPHLIDTALSATPTTTTSSPLAADASVTVGSVSSLSTPAQARDVIRRSISAVMSRVASLDDIVARGAAVDDALRAHIDGLRGKLREAIARREAALSDASVEARRAADAQAAVQAAESAKLVAETRGAYTSRQLASLESLLKTYEAEDKQAVAAAGTRAAASQATSRPPRGAGAPATVLAARVTTLERALSEAQASNAALTQRLETVAATAKAASRSGGLPLACIMARLAVAEAEAHAAAKEAEALYSYTPAYALPEGPAGSPAESYGYAGRISSVPFDPSACALDARKEEGESAACVAPAAAAVAGGAEVAIATSRARAAPRVLHLVLNPTSAAVRSHTASLVALVEALRNEVGALRAAAAAAPAAGASTSSGGLAAGATIGTAGAPAAVSTAVSASSLATGTAAVDDAAGSLALDVSSIGAAGMGANAADIEKLRVVRSETLFGSSVLSTDLPSISATTNPLVALHSVCSRSE